jgi:hypothetical protein
MDSACVSVFNSRENFMHQNFQAAKCSLFSQSSPQAEAISTAALATPAFQRCAASLAILGGLSLALMGCGGQSSSAPPSQPVTITAQPVNQTVPIGQTATFTITAIGTAPISYQWTENGQPIPGATEASYTTPPIALGASGSTTIGSFQVTASNSVNSVNSTTATLAAGARSPKSGDLRYLLFEQVSLPGLINSGANNLWYMSSFSYSNAVGTPLWLGAGVLTGGGPCTWHINWYSLPSPMDNLSVFYDQGFLNSTTVAAYLQSVAAPNVVITSMDIEMGCPSLPAYPGGPEVGPEIAVSWVQASQNIQGTFDQRLEVVPPAQVQEQVTADGQASRIVTAASFDGNGNVNLLSYGWTGDTTTVYETQTYLVPPKQVASAATDLAAGGYFISAFGGNDADGYVLVGARVHGDTLPRAMFINGTLIGTPNTGVGPYGYGYFTPVVILNETNGTTVFEQ